MVFGVEIICIFDKDNEKNVNHMVINRYISENIKKNLCFYQEFENELDYTIEQERRKPQIFLEKYFNNQIDKQKIENLKNKIIEIYNR